MNEAASLRIDPDDLAEIVREIERSLAIELPRDLRDVVTAGDLHSEVLAVAGTARGSACPTSMAFYRVRREMISAGLPCDARPDAPLVRSGFRSPRALRRHLDERTQWTMPGLVVGRVGCAAMLVGSVASVGAWWTGHPWVSVPLMITAAVILLRFDPGVWAGNWATVGTLARSIAATNHVDLVRAGARHSPATIWQVISRHIMDGTDREAVITPHVRLMD